MDLSTTIGECLPRKAKVGLIGLEMEMEFGDLEPVYVAGADGPGGGWALAEDGSLRRGLETKLKSPVNLPKLAEQLDLYQAWLKGLRTKAIPSIRCSTHIHVNMSKRTLLETFQSVYAAWALEYGLILTQSPFRHNNIYCVPITRSVDLVREVTTNIAGQSFHPPSLVREAHRYAATNLHSLGTFGSMEFRFFDGVIEMDKVGNWAQCVAGLIERASEMSIDAQEEMIFTEPEKYLDAMLGEFSGVVRRAVKGDVMTLLDMSGFARASLKAAVEVAKTGGNDPRGPVIMTDNDDILRLPEVQHYQNTADI